MGYDFDRIINRQGTDSIKYDMEARGKSPDLLSLWVADMDFQAPPCVIEALKERSEHGIFGYTESGEAYFQAVSGWFRRRFGWQVEPDWLVQTPGVVAAIHMILGGLTLPGDSVIIQEPVYYPFASAVRLTGRNLVVSELRSQEGRYTMDLADFEEKIVQNKVKLFILCNPHNPVGRVWSRDELTAVGDICLRHGVLVVSDEIHQDFIYPGHKHQVFADLKPEYRDITITCTAPSKTFNLAGLQISNIFIANRYLRKQFMAEYHRSGLSQLSVMGMVACRAAYEHGEDWLEELLQYLQGNIRLIGEFCEGRLPGVRFLPPEGTYLAWLDFRSLGLGAEELDDFIEHKAGLWLDGGTMFGPAGAGYQRVNFACPRSLLQQALERVETALASYSK